MAIILILAFVTL